MPRRQNKEIFNNDYSEYNKLIYSQTVAQNSNSGSMDAKSQQLISHATLNPNSQNYLRVQLIAQ